MKPLAAFLSEKGIGVEQLIAESRLDSAVVKAIVDGQYTPSPFQRQRLAAVLGVAADEIAWGHSIAVQHLRGNGPQTGRAT